jgi:hypothetical protein
MELPVSCHPVLPSAYESIGLVVVNDQFDWCDMVESGWLVVLVVCGNPYRFGGIGEKVV